MKLAIIGAGEQAKEILSLYTRYEYAGDQYDDFILVDLYADPEKGIIAEDAFFEKPVEEYDVIVAMGEPKMREKMLKKYAERGYRFATYIHHSVVIGMDCIIKPGTVLLPFVYIGQDTVIGENTLVHAGARIENNCKIGSNCMISSGSFVGAKTRIGNTTFVGPNAAVKDGLSVGDNVIIGMSSCVIRDVHDHAVMAGNPSRQIRENTTGRVFN